MQYLLTRYNVCHFAIFVLYAGWRRESVSWNILAATCTMLVGRLSRSPTTAVMLASGVNIVRFGCLVEAYFYGDEHTFAILLAAFTSVWMMVEQDLSFKGDSGVSSGTANLKSGPTVIFFCDSKIPACVEFSHVFANLSVAMPEVEFRITELTPDLAAKQWKVLYSQPVVCKYRNGVEVLRIALPVSQASSLDRSFWFKNIKKRLSEEA